MEKAPGDVVTVADYEAEVRLSKALGALAPGAEILAEEAASRDGLELDDYHSDADTWLIDPVDGTRNFSKGETPFAIVVAYVTGGRVEQAWIHLPVEDQTIVAERGSGAFVVGGERLAISNDVAISSMTGLINFRALGDSVSVEQMKSRAEAFSELRNFRCAGFDFVQLAKGNKHFFALSSSLALGPRSREFDIQRSWRICRTGGWTRVSPSGANVGPALCTVGKVLAGHSRTSIDTELDRSLSIWITNLWPNGAVSMIAQQRQRADSTGRNDYGESCFHRAWRDGVSHGGTLICGWP